MTVRRYYLLALPRLEGACVAFGGTRIDQVGEGLNALYASHRGFCSLQRAPNRGG